MLPKTTISDSTALGTSSATISEASSEHHVTAGSLIAMRTTGALLLLFSGMDETLALLWGGRLEAVAAAEVVAAVAAAVDSPIVSRCNTRDAKY